MSAQQPSAQDILAAGIIGVGSYLPERIVTNANLELMVNTSDEWITHAPESVKGTSPTQMKRLLILLQRQQRMLCKAP